VQFPILTLPKALIMAGMDAEAKAKALRGPGRGSKVRKVRKGREKRERASETHRERAVCLTCVCVREELWGRR